MGKCGLHSSPQRAVALGLEERYAAAIGQQLAAGLELPGRGKENRGMAALERLGPLQRIGCHVPVELPGSIRADAPCKAGFYFSRFRCLNEDTQVGWG